MASGPATVQRLSPPPETGCDRNDEEPGRLPGLQERAWGNGSGDAVEPEGGEAGPGDDEHERTGGEPLGHLPLLVREADLGPDALVDRLEVLRRRRREESRAGPLRHVGEGR